MGGVVSSIFGGGKTPSVSTVSPPDNSAAMAAAEAKRRKLAASARGRSSTMITDPAALGEASTAKKTLLGS